MLMLLENEYRNNQIEINSPKLGLKEAVSPAKKKIKEITSINMGISPKFKTHGEAVSSKYDRKKNGGVIILERKKMDLNMQTRGCIQANGDTAGSFTSEFSRSDIGLEVGNIKPVHEDSKYLKALTITKCGKKK